MRLLLLLWLLPLWATAQQTPLSITLEGYEYPYPVNYLDLNIEGQELKMAYMDVAPTGKANGQTIVLLHGKNFMGAYWRETIKYLTGRGYRVVVPDQIGFGKSSKPDIHYSFHLMAMNTRQMLDKLGISKVVVIGHSMGGMLATRFTLMYPEIVSKLVLENPIGLEDYRPLVPYQPLEEIYKGQLKTTEESTRNYHKTYYPVWKPEYDEWVQVAARQLKSSEYPRLAKSAALTYQMIYEQPVSYEFGLIKVPTLLIIGQADRTVVGKDRLKAEYKDKAGQYPQLGRKVQQAIPGAKLAELEGVGHIPHVQVTERFHDELIKFL
jgi:pimeloyl-ACP methyl ester carboxylesterase